MVVCRKQYIALVMALRMCLGCIGLDDADHSVSIIISMPELSKIKDVEIYLKNLISIKTTFLSLALFYCFSGCRYFRYISKQDHQALRKKFKRIKKLVKKYSVVNPGL